MKVEQSKLNEYLKKIHGSACPLCGNNHWSISDQIFQAIEFAYSGLPIGGASYPMVPLVCDNCGNTYFINALKAGFLDFPEPEKLSGTNLENEK